MLFHPFCTPFFTFIQDQNLQFSISNYPDMNKIDLNYIKCFSNRKIIFGCMVFQTTVSSAKIKPTSVFLNLIF